DVDAVKSLRLDEALRAGHIFSAENPAFHLCWRPGPEPEPIFSLPRPLSPEEIARKCLIERTPLQHRSPDLHQTSHRPPFGTRSVTRSLRLLDCCVLGGKRQTVTLP